MSKTKKEVKTNILKKLIIVGISLIIIIEILYLAGHNYIRDDITNRTNLIINNGNVTTSLKADVYIQDGTIYLSKADIDNFFDNTIYYDEQYNQIITCSENKIASLPIDSSQIKINSSNQKINASVIIKDDTYFIPISELGDVYNTQTTYIESKNIVLIDSLDRAYSIATLAKNSNIKYKPSAFSRTVAKIKQGEAVSFANRSEYPVPEGWARVRTQDGIIGYIKTNRMGKTNEIRQTLEKTPKMEGKVSLVWDFYSKYVYAPTRTENIKGINVVSPSFFYISDDETAVIKENIDYQGELYIAWAQKNGYKIWPMLSNADISIDETSKILKDYKLREKLINQIVDYIVKYKLDGINIDFEYMYKTDKDYFSRFLIELEPRLNEIGAVLSVDVTAPDGAEEWSMCYDRYTIGKVADYIVFMAYDQYGASSNKAGTTAGCDWVEANIKKFLGQEGVTSSKIILGIPFYTNLWKKSGKAVSSDTVNMKSIDNVLPSNVNKKWDEDLKQYYVEYTRNGATYKMWIEDEKSIEAKLNLIEQYKLAGASYWAKDRESASVWNLISSKLGIK